MPELMKEQWQIDQSNQAVPADSAVSAFVHFFGSISIAVGFSVMPKKFLPGSNKRGSFYATTP